MVWLRQPVRRATSAFRKQRETDGPQSKAQQRGKEAMEENPQKCLWENQQAGPKGHSKESTIFMSLKNQGPEGNHFLQKKPQLSGQRSGQLSLEAHSTLAHARQAPHSVPQ